ncbi:DUF1093 domain-containing protein [Vagococcus carniphilus]|uniref:DUF1093 domain-containing protein n=1 Tax=Vagococcus carniphilus TaxID=218144 RepID=A0A430B0E7_9ENTE|nr:DUF1093 domain-containing protein [Vagococcus carniphilus]QNN73044.1 DUF1093 domain-containing protein [Vagococcus carniphilus]RSU13692.1 hypothetical protein CBF28_09415 [Vagococcus carniphilus]
MKKIIPIIFVAILGVVGFKTYAYYNDTYKATTAYAVVPAEVPEKKEALDMSGKKIKESDGTLNYSYDYSFDFVKENGKRQTQSYSMTSPNPTPYQPGTIVKAEISNKRVVKGPYVTEEKNVPKDILEQLRK